MVAFTIAVTATALAAAVLFAAPPGLPVTVLGILSTSVTVSGLVNIPALRPARKENLSNWHCRK